MASSCCWIVWFAAAAQRALSVSAPPPHAPASCTHPAAPAAPSRCSFRSAPPRSGSTARAHRTAASTASPRSRATPATGSAPAWCASCRRSSCSAAASACCREREPLGPAPSTRERADAITGSRPPAQHLLGLRKGRDHVAERVQRPVDRLRLSQRIALCRVSAHGRPPSPRLPRTVTPDRRTFSEPAKSTIMSCADVTLSVATSTCRTSTMHTACERDEFTLDSVEPCCRRMAPARTM